MRVFISWSGEQSKLVAEALREWLQYVVQAAEPWTSSADVEPGQRWHRELTDKLEHTRFGIICVTCKNLQKPWLLYEAGALSKSVDGARVVPYLLDVEPTSLIGPLAHFQCIKADRDGTLKLVRSMNAALDAQARSLHVIDAVFEALWPKLSEKLADASARFGASS